MAAPLVSLAQVIHQLRGADFILELFVVHTVETSRSIHQQLVLSVSSPGQPRIHCWEDRWADGGQWAEAQCRWCSGHSTGSGAHEVCVQGEVKKTKTLHIFHTQICTVVDFSWQGRTNCLTRCSAGVTLSFSVVCCRIAVFSVSVLHDERIVVVAEQRPDASEEDSFQWMSRVLQVLHHFHFHSWSLYSTISSSVVSYLHFFGISSVLYGYSPLVPVRQLTMATNQPSDFY